MKQSFNTNNENNLETEAAINKAHKRIEHTHNIIRRNQRRLQSNKIQVQRLRQRVVEIEQHIKMRQEQIYLVFETRLAKQAWASNLEKEAAELLQEAQFCRAALEELRSEDSWPQEIETLTLQMEHFAYRAYQLQHQADMFKKSIRIQDT
jgi:hypothetical protein